MSCIRCGSGHTGRQHIKMTHATKDGPVVKMVPTDVCLACGETWPAPVLAGKPKPEGPGPHGIEYDVEKKEHEATIDTKAVPPAEDKPKPPASKVKRAKARKGKTRGRSKP